MSNQLNASTLPPAADRTGRSRLGTYLMVFLGLAIVLGSIAWGYWRLNSDVRSGNVQCNPIVVSFSDTATMTQINTLLERLNASIAFGPNQNGAFELHVAGNDPDAAVAALNRVNDMVVMASLQESCIAAP